VQPLEEIPELLGQELVEPTQPPTPRTTGASVNTRYLPVPAASEGRGRGSDLAVTAGELNAGATRPAQAGIESWQLNSAGVCSRG
jgi:hypothetical protein